MVDVAAADIINRHEPAFARIARLVKDQGCAFEPEVLAAMDAAYHAVLQELRLDDREDAGTLMVARRIVELAGGGERDPQRLAEATLGALSR
jgi:hypothetical protein